MRTEQEVCELAGLITPPLPVPSLDQCQAEWFPADTFRFGRSLGRIETLQWLLGDDGEVDPTANEDFAEYVHRCGIETNPDYVDALEHGLKDIREAAETLRMLCLAQLSVRGITSWSQGDDSEICFAVNGVEATLGYWVQASPFAPTGPRLCCIGVLVGTQIAQRAVFAESEQKVIRAINAAIDEARLFA
jgi:hypothetical protein